MKMKILKLKYVYSSSGQALISLLFFVLIGVTIVSAAAIFVYENVQSASITEQGTLAYYTAESGIEEALLQLLRDPSYLGIPAGSPLSVGEGTVTIQVSSSSGIFTTTATGIFRSAVRKIQVQTVYNNNILTILSWKEIP